MDTSPYLIPRTLDDPPRMLLLPVDEFFVGAVALLVGTFSHGFATGFAGAILAIWALRRTKGSENANLLRNGLCWFAPNWISSLKTGPGSHVREFVG
jgi:type IV conjugative transfer system protein TraL